MKKNLIAIPMLLSLGAATLAGCAEPPAEPGTQPTGGEQATTGGGGSGNADFKACMVSDSGGFDDKSFNQTSHKGLTDAKDELGIETAEVESKNVSDFTKNIQSMVDADCSVVVTVGFLLADATIAAAKANPDIQFAIVDAAPEGYEDVPNLKPLEFNTAESSFLGGYLAASQSTTGKVGTFGGANIPTVTIFMDGFAQGVAYYNEQKGTDVQVIGWNAEKQDGQFVSGDNPFENVAGGKQVAEDLVRQGADILFPVAGPAGEGALQVAKASGDKVHAIWVDTDGCVSAEAYCSSLVSSVFKGMDLAVTDAIRAAYEDKWDNTPYVGTLENEGTGLSPFHEFDSKISDEVKSELEQLKADIISGAITIESQAQPQG
ncbi:MAG TPA: BMP family ABC transporter substrate-binding protein [Candidatus Avipropionibacterium avicola]|uniref:BMP family ABC transporter substrate-binding protein n=1 Tax=Candidatus Avipropionibacterium avicola TaxID=2840701 RepID=A0A9D1GXP8_9ACTN|nr:BMP family ABC transporter substrate-binding protein [Candidatus Avipropionibacterium avicola]